MSEFLDKTYKDSLKINIDDNDRIIIFSDLHIGNRKYRDDFKNNSNLFMTFLEKKYLPEKYTLILNGDIEELQRVSFKKIYRKWNDFYDLIDKFHNSNKLFKLVGNHDQKLLKIKKPDNYPPLIQSILLKYYGGEIMVYHGHQASAYKDFRNALIGLILKTIIHPLGIKNFTRSYDNNRKHKTEQIIYDYSFRKKIISIIGHTHRPLFESFSEEDYIKFSIENLINEYLEKNKNPDDREKIKKEINTLKKDLTNKTRKNYPTLNDTLYNSEIITPVLFNSGYAIGKKGFTGIEISEKNISLMHYFTPYQNDKYFHYPESEIHLLNCKETKDCCYVVLKKDSLETIFTKIELLT